MLGSPFVIGGSPRTNTLQTEYVVTLVQYSKLLPIGQHLLKTDLALMVIFICVAVLALRCAILQRVLKWTASAILARVSLVEHAHSLLWLLA